MQAVGDDLVDRVVTRATAGLLEGDAGFTAGHRGHDRCSCAARLSALDGSPRSDTTTSAVRPPAREYDGVRSGPSTDLTAGSRRAPASSAATATRRPSGVMRTDKHVFGSRSLEARGRQPGVGARRLPGARAGVGERAHAGHRAERHACGDQGKPERDRQLRAAGRAAGRRTYKMGEHTRVGGTRGMRWWVKV